FVPIIERFRASEIARPETRGRGSNYAGYQSGEMERLLNGYETALRRDERNQYAVQMMKLISEDLPIIPLYYNLEFLAHVSADHLFAGETLEDVDSAANLRDVINDRVLKLHRAPFLGLRFLELQCGHQVAIKLLLPLDHQGDIFVGFFDSQQRP